MNRPLANYLFGNETLYAPKENLVLVEEKIMEEKILEFKHKLLLISYEITSTERILLGKILAAIGFNFDTIDLIELKKGTIFDKKLIDYQAFIAQKLTRRVISFDVALAKINWSKALTLNVVETDGTVDFLLTNSLAQVEENINIKKALWANLQKLYPK